MRKSFMALVGAAALLSGVGAAANILGGESNKQVTL